MPVLTSLMKQEAHNEMIHVGRQVPKIILGRGFFFRLNESLLVPWRLASFILHCAALLCVADYRHTLIVEGSLLSGFSNDDLDFFMRSANGAIAATILCLVVCMSGVITGRSLRLPGVNLVHCVCHSVGGVLLMMIWFHTSHIERVWHVFYFFSLIPAIIEILSMIFSFLRGFDLWR